MITAGSNNGMLSSEHMYMMNSMSLTSVYRARISAWVDDVDTITSIVEGAVGV